VTRLQRSSARCQGLATALVGCRPCQRSQRRGSRQAQTACHSTARAATTDIARASRALVAIGTMRRTSSSTTCPGSPSLRPAPIARRTASHSAQLPFVARHRAPDPWRCGRHRRVYSPCAASEVFRRHPEAIMPITSDNTTARTNATESQAGHPRPRHPAAAPRRHRHRRLRSSGPRLMREAGWPSSWFPSRLWRERSRPVLRRSVHRRPRDRQLRVAAPRAADHERRR